MTIFSSIMILPIIRHFYSQLVYLDRPGAGDMAFLSWRLYHALSLFLVSTPSIFPIGISSFARPSIWFMKLIPRNANAKEVREFMMSMMDGKP